MNRTQKPSGFTLIELLVVIVIVAALSSLVFLGVKRAVSGAKSAKSVSNLKQISLGIESIMADGVQNGHNIRGTYPPYAGWIKSPVWAQFNLYELLGEEAGLCQLEGNKYSWSVHPSETFLQNPLSEHKLCGDTPIVSIENATFKAGEGLRGGYAYNHLIEGWVGPATPEEKVKGTRAHRIKRPASIILVAEQNPDKGAIWFGPYANAIPQGTYKDKTHCLMVDGHVELIDNTKLADLDEAKRLMKP
ncbi:prepilin-type cleavage/methylation protein [Haloferula helveola]|uniref:Prepilin-type cleavage/methylation protein n=1 Tax=Haloferula helveola TaxID=490095 RepID=A0ABM7REM1_9BACT|nr:prepilin-type cleavage/methylation protein [Haloferula helveola]